MCRKELGLVSESNRHIIDSPDHPQFRLYQLWKGSNIFFLKGRLIFGPDLKSLFITVFLILIPVILFSAFVSQRLAVEFHHNLGNLIVVICLLFTLYVILLLFLTSGRDPGIVPRNWHPPEPEEEGHVFSGISSDWRPRGNEAPTLPPTKDVMVNGHLVQVKYCKTCLLYRPPRCSHCSICDNCVERFDHHCPWVGQCIGQRNYRFFFMFISSTTLLCVYVFAFCWVNIGNIMQAYRCNLWRAFLNSPVSGILILYTFVMCWFVGGLTMFHIYLICTNQTTYENFRYSYEGKINPYNRGCVCNFVEILCWKIPRSKNRFRAKVERDGRSASEITEMLEMREIGKRQAVGAEELEDIRTEMESIGVLERCETEPTWDVQMLPAARYDFTRRHRVHSPAR